jgi:hypothetical protein
MPTIERAEKRIDWPHFHLLYFVEEFFSALSSSRSIRITMNHDAIMRCMSGKASYSLVMIWL